MMKITIDILKITLAIFIGLGLATAENAQIPDQGNVKLTVKTDRENYIPGEMVDLRVNLSNGGDSKTAIGSPEALRASIRVYLAFEGGKYREYVGPQDATIMGVARAAIKADSGDAVTTNIKVLYHQLKPTEHLSELYANQIRDRELNDYFALSRAGHYLMKVVFQDSSTKQVIESEPVTLYVDEPTGFDAIIWDAIKDDPKAAAFLHTGKIAGGGPNYLSACSLERFSELYPDSTLGKRVASILDTNAAQTGQNEQFR